MPQEFVVTGPRALQFRDYEEPPLEPAQVRVRNLVSGIKSGTEMAIYRGTAPTITHRFDRELRLFVPRETSAYPTYLGSWATGEVIEVGREVMGLQVGDRVHGPLRHRPTNVIRASRLHLLGDLPPETALFTDPLLFALQSVHDAALKVGDAVAIFGMGLIGLLTVQVARLNGASQVLAVDLIPRRLELARELGADTVVNPSQASDVALGKVELKDAVQEGGRLGGAEPKCVSANLAEIAARAKASERQRRVGPACDHEP